MPLYEFICRDCEREQELLIRGAESPVCESCGGHRLTKLLSAPAGHAAKDAGGGEPFPRPTGSCGAGCGCFPD